MGTMIKSMTGYGKAHYEDALRRISVEVKSINAKYADVSLQLPKVFSAQEIAWRNLVVAYLQRGKITLFVTYEQKDASLSSVNIHKAWFKQHYHALHALAEEVGASSTALFQLALQFPDVITKHHESILEEEVYPILEQVIRDALQQCDQHRQAEGDALSKQLSENLQTIWHGLKKITQCIPSRNQTMRERLWEHIKASIPMHVLDKNRLEQEMIYYLERLDITEETVRLGQHLTYFEEVMKGTPSSGKKMGFIAQEIGREINTIGSKANDVVMQKEVILMKDALEKIKEQLLNIL